MKEKKTYSRSVRMTETVRAYVESQTGDGFNEKFENMVLYCMEKDQKLRRQIAEKEKVLKDLSTKVLKMQSVLLDFDSMRLAIEQVINRANAIIKKDKL